MAYGKKTAILVLLSLLPVFIHLTLLVISIITKRYVPSSGTDLLLFAAIALYLLLIYAIRNNKEYLIRLVLVVYSLFISLISFEFLLTDIYPSEHMLRRHMHRISYAADGVMPGINGKIEFSINKYGLRGPEVNLNKPDFSILVVGGSTAECLYITDRLSWPWRLQDKLAARSGKSVFVGNAGMNSDFTLDHIYLLENYKWIHKFDWIVILCGLNDTGTFLRQNYKKRALQITLKSAVYYKNLKLYHILKDLFRPYPTRDIIGRDVILQDPQGLWYEDARQTRKRALSNHAITEKPQNLGIAINLYKDNLRNIIGICKKRRQNILMLTQPSMWRKDLPKNLEDLLWEYVNEEKAYTTEVLEQILKSYNSAMMDVCKKEGVPCLDLAGLLPKDTSVFYDDAHFNISGCELISEILTNEMIRLLAR